MGLLGPNGAGKSTLVRVLCGLLEPWEGAVRVDGKPITLPEARKQLGIAFQDDAIYQEFTPTQNAWIFGTAYGLRGQALRARIQAVLQEVDLWALRGKPVAALSGGQKRKLNLVLSWIHDPTYLLLDEPTAGLDPGMRWELHEMLRAKASQGIGILITTHDMREAEEVCDRVYILHQGRLLASGAPQELVRQSGRCAVVRVWTEEPEKLMDALQAWGGARKWRKEEEYLLVALPEERLPELLRRLEEWSVRIREVSFKPAGLEATFLLLTA